MSSSAGSFLGNFVAPTSAAATGIFSIAEVYNLQRAGRWLFQAAPQPVQPVPGFQISRSLRFNSADSAYLNRTSNVASTSTKKGTISFWWKRASLSSAAHFTGEQWLFYSGTSNRFGVYIAFTNLLAVEWGSGPVYLVPAQVWRDPSAWYHVVLAWDTTQATASNRLKYYVNGSQVTAFATEQYVSQDANLDWMANGVSCHIGSIGGGARPLDAYLTEFHFIDGQTLTPSDFGETDAITGQWKAKAYTGESYGTNGFYLPFSNNASTTQLGLDGKSNAITGSTGASPILNISGRSASSGVNSDSNSTSLVFAASLDSNANLTVDHSPSGRTSSIKTITNTSVTLESNIYKLYSGSALFNGTNARLSVPNSADFQFGTGDFTIEGWINPVALKTNAIFAKCSNNATWQSGWTCEINSGYIGIYEGSIHYTASTNLLAINNWYHVAWARQGSTLRMFVNGNLAHSVTVSTNLVPTAPFTICNDSVDTTYAQNARVQDVRLYKGVAKYTAAFTPPLFNDWAANNFSVDNVTNNGVGNDSLTDVPNSYGTDTGLGGQVGGNYCTLNPLHLPGATISNGNLAATCPTGITYYFARGTIAIPQTGKWYWETTITTLGLYVSVGVVAATNQEVSSNSVYLGSITNSAGYFGGSGVESIYANGSFVASVPTTSDGDVIMCAISDNKVYLGKNGTWANSANPVAGTGSVLTATAELLPAISIRGTTAPVVNLNFGQRPFKYAAPEGFKALCTTNLPTPVIQKPSTAMDVVTYTGDGAASGRVISGLNFSPDLVWIKSRSINTGNHFLFDSVRGATKVLGSNQTIDEYTNGDFGLGTGSFTIGDNGASDEYNPNKNNSTYVAWAWDEGAIQGFDIVTYTGDGTTSANRLIDHSLGVKPDFIITKKRSSGTTDYGWSCWHKDLGGNYGIWLDSTNARNISMWSGYSNFSATKFTPPELLYGNENNQTYVNYLWSEVQGYSKFGSYTGNDSTDGPFVYTGFRPRWILLRDSTIVYNWNIYDAVRNTYNVVNTALEPHSDKSESNVLFPGLVDILSNGFKIRSSNATSYINRSGGIIIYAAFAESPFKYARAR